MIMKQEYSFREQEQELDFPRENSPARTFQAGSYVIL